MKSGKHLKVIGLLVVLLVLPLLTGNRYNQHIINMILIYIILGMSLNLCFGYTGLLSLGHAAFFGLGAYASALASTKLGLPFPACFLSAGMIGLLFGVLIGFPTLRLSGPYFAMATIGFNKIVEMVLMNWDEVTGGPAGIANIRDVSLFGFPLDTEYRYYFLLLPMVLILYTLYRNLINSHFGRTVLALRDNAIAAQAMGVNTTFLRVAIFSLSTLLAALAGSLYVHMNGYVSPDAFPVMESITLLILVVVGGPGFKSGPVYGAIILVLAGEYLQLLESYNMLIYGGVLMILLIVMPSGIAGLIEAAKFRYFNSRSPGSYIREVGIEEIR
jgi:branched-chain amino acid transport system permease protein